MTEDIELLEAEQRWSDFFNNKKTVSKVIRSKTLYPNRKAITIKNNSKVSRMFEPIADHMYVTAPSYWANETYPLHVQVGSEIMEIDQYISLDRTEGKLHIAKRGCGGSRTSWHYKKTKVQHVTL